MAVIPQLSESSRYIMELLWDNGPLPAKYIAARLGEERGYTKGTTYKLLDRMLKKGFIKKEEPTFLYVPLFTRDEIVRNETQSFLNRFFQGSFSNLAAQLVENKQLSQAELEAIRRIIDPPGAHESEEGDD